MGRFKELVDTEEKMRNFRTKYNIPPHVGVRYAAQGEWYDERKTNEVVIPHVREYPRTINKRRDKIILRGEVKNARGGFDRIRGL